MCDIVVVLLWYWCDIVVISVWYWCYMFVVLISWCDNNMISMCCCCAIVVITLWFRCDMYAIVMTYWCNTDGNSLWYALIRNYCYNVLISNGYRYRLVLIMIWTRWAIDLGLILRHVEPHPPTTSLSPVGWSYRYICMFSVGIHSPAPECKSIR